MYVANKNFALFTLISLTPFINQTTSEILQFNSYLLISIFCLVVIFFNRMLTFEKTSISHVLIIILLFSYFCILNIWQFEKLILYLILFGLCLILYFISPRRLSTDSLFIQRIFLIILSVFLVIIEIQGIIINIATFSRTAIQGSVLGLAVLLNFASLYFTLEGVTKGKIFLIFCGFLFVMFSIIAFKTKGPLIALGIALGIFFTRRPRYFFVLIAAGIIFTLVYYFQRQSGLNSIGIRQELYNNIINELNVNPWWNLFSYPKYNFHNFILEMVWRIGLLVIPFILLILITVLVGSRRSLSSYGVVFYAVCGLFSFPLDNVLFALSVMCLSVLADLRTREPIVYTSSFEN